MIIQMFSTICSCISPSYVIGRSSTNSSQDPKADDTHSTLKDPRDSVLTIMRDVSKGTILVSSKIQRPKRLTSTTLLLRLLVVCIDNAKSHTSFPQSNHLTTSPQIINDKSVAMGPNFQK